MEDIKVMKDGISEVISKTQMVINDFVDRVNYKKNEANGIDTIKKELKEAINQLDGMKSTIDNFVFLCTEMMEFLQKQQDDLSISKYELIEENKLQLYELINQNLPDKMVLNRASDDIWEVCLKKDESITKGKRKYKEPSLWKKDEIVVGEIKVSENNNQFVLKIKIGNEEGYEDFKVENVLRVFPIVNHISTRHNYKGDKPTV